MARFLKALWDWFWGTQQSWRDQSLNKEQNEAILEEVNKIQPAIKRNILILGPIGAGKSSYISSVISIDKGRKFGMTISGDIAETSCTIKLVDYSSQKLLKGYRLFDCMGIEAAEKRGCLTDDLMFLIKGHIKKGYKFNSDKPINKNDPCYRRDPTFEDQMHCVIFVVCAKSVHAGLQNEYVEKIKTLQLKLREENIPQVMVLTKVDLICDEVKKDGTKMFTSIKVQDIVKNASENFGIEEAMIHPVVNYVGDFNIHPVKNIPILLALRQAMQFSQDRVDHVEQEKKDGGGKNK